MRFKLWRRRNLTAVTEGTPLDCDLCRIYEKREIITTLRFEDDRLIIVDCMICSVPMVVAKQHDVPVPEALDSLMEERLREVADGILGPENYYVDKHERLIADHRHFHARRKGAW